MCPIYWRCLNKQGCFLLNCQKCSHRSTVSFLCYPIDGHFTTNPPTHQPFPTPHPSLHPFFPHLFLFSFLSPSMPLSTPFVLFISCLWADPPNPPVIVGLEREEVKAERMLKLECISYGGNPLATLHWTKVMRMYHLL